MSNPDADIALKFYNLPDTDFMASMINVILPAIAVNQIIYVPMLEPRIDDNLITDLLNGEFEEAKDGPPTRHYSDEMEVSRTRIYQTESEHYDPNEYVRVRILSSRELTVDWKLRQVMRE